MSVDNETCCFANLTDIKLILLFLFFFFYYHFVLSDDVFATGACESTIFKGRISRRTVTAVGKSFPGNRSHSYRKNCCEIQVLSKCRPVGVTSSLG